MIKSQGFFLNCWQACLLVFLIAVAIRLATLNQMGRTWDEGAYVEAGYHYVELAQEGNFNDPFWYIQSDHPPLARYVYGLASVFDIKDNVPNGEVEFNYNFTFPRLASILLGSLATLFVVILGYKYFSGYIGVASGLIFALIPFFVGLSQLATLESFIMFFFTGTMYFYIDFLVTRSIKALVLAGIFCGLAILVKQSNVILYLLLVCSVLIWTFYNKSFNFKQLGIQIIKFVFFCLISLFIFFILWPMPFFHMKETWAVQQTMWIDAVHLPPPEVFFGRLMLVPFPYYFLMFIITTPLVLLVLAFLGALKIDRNRSFISVAVLIWFLFPILQSFYAFKQHGVRYIIEIYAPFAILCGLGISYLSQWFGTRRIVKPAILGFVVVYLLLVLVNVKPYYLDYFNEVVGGNKNVYEKKLFQMGWWGQGIGEAAFFISRSERQNVTVAVDGGQPMIVMPNLKNISAVDYNTNKNADYVIVPYFNVVRLWFPEHELIGKYEVVHTVTVDSVPLVKVYKKKFPKLNY